MADGELWFYQMWHLRHLTKKPGWLTVTIRDNYNMNTSQCFYIYTNQNATTTLQTITFIVVFASAFL